MEVYDYRGETHFALPGDIVLINPDMVHTGHAGAESGWAYRVFYPSIDLIRGLAEDIGQKAEDMPYFKATVIKDAELSWDIKAVLGLFYFIKIHHFGKGFFGYQPTEFFRIRACSK